MITKTIVHRCCWDPMRNMLSHYSNWTDEDRQILRFVVKPIMGSINEIIVSETIQEKTNKMRRDIKTEIKRAAMHG